MDKSLRKTILAGNWKMNKTRPEAKALIEGIKPLAENADCEVVICVPFTNLETAVEMTKGTNIKVGAENVHFEKSGAFTGEISADMLTEIGVEYVIIGHSERRQYFGETDETVNLKMIQAINNGINPIVCVGESLEQYEANETKDVVKTQVVAAYKDIAKEDVEKTVIAYEPIWAIGTGKTATNEIAQDVCGYIRTVVADLYDQETADKVRIQYGGSVKPAGLAALLEQPDIDGALVGGASLQVESYIAMIEALN